MNSRAWRVIGVIAACLLVAGAWFAVWRSAQPAFSPDDGTLPSVILSAEQQALACVQDLPIGTLLGQKLMVAGYSAQLSAESAVLARYNISGVVMMDQVPSQAVDQLQSAQKIKLTVAVDQEGGTVQRYESAGPMLGAEQMARQKTSDQAFDIYLMDFQSLAHSGITTNFAPVVDVRNGSVNPLPGRMYSTDPSVVASYATEAVKAAQMAGITPVIKHFPGLGTASGNTDLGPATTAPIASLRNRDMVPYKKLAPLKPDVMVSNAIVPDLTDGQPAVWSKPAVDLLRSLGYQDAVVYSDSLTARAISGTLADAVIKTWQAGVDVALIVQTTDNTDGLDSLLAGITAAAGQSVDSGTLTKGNMVDSVNRILTRKSIAPCSLVK